VRFVLGQLSASVVSSSATLSPNGENVVFSQPGSGLLVRSLGALVARPLAGTEMATHPFISPDGRWIGFFTAQDKLGKVPTDGSAPPVMLAPASRFSNGSWSADGVIVADRPRGGLVRFDAATGATRPLTAIDTARGERGHVHPRVLPDAKSVVFTVARGPAETTRALELAVVPLDNAATAASAHTLLGVSGSFAVALVDDWLVYGALDRSGLMAVRFDANHRRAMGTPVEVLHEPEGGVQDAVLASNGTLVYTRRMSSGDLVLVDAHGGARTLVSDTALGGRGYMYPRVSPDGQRIAAVGRAASGQTKVWVYEFGPGTRTQFSMGGEWLDVDWAPDSRRILFSAGAGHAFWLQSIDARAPPEKVAEVSGAFAGAFTPGGRALVFQRKVSGVWGIWSVALSGDRAPTPILTGPYTFYMPAVSPNERWLAYVSNESGREEVYVRPFPGPGVAVQVSEKGGTEPAWAPNGQRLFYRTGRDMLAATISDTAGFTVTTRESLFRDSFVGDMPHTNYAVYAGEGGRADGDRFIMFGTAAETRPDAVVVVNWLPELRAALAGARGSRSR
jgi:serine/threonine-protein kinase